ncbi:olfactory receptor 14A16-like [Alligator mississippiensis]|uniref:olfactory receptor 14A16-like n=1 Tax=Alligator mississippiensis TaxID=8496 RepID=UPI0003D0BE10|nr:olfactory receptor 14A16-like [Alligator mississippiensis]
MSNETTVTEFLLLGFSDTAEQQIIYSVVFLIVYLAALIWNLLIILVVAFSHHLHSPMYFFLGNLSFLDICYISVTVPKCIANSLTSTRVISFCGCVGQVFLLVLCGAAEMALLTVMAYDRYVAICLPLHYREIMNWGACVQMAAGSWICSMVYSVIHTVTTFRLDFCQSNILDNFFCDIPQLLKLSCSDTLPNEILLFLSGIFSGSICFTLVLMSYIDIFVTVMRIPSTQGKYKAFSTCLPHLIIFGLFVSTSLFAYMRPKSISSPYRDVLAAVFYAVMPPTVNPLIYSLRNREIKVAFTVLMRRMLFHKRNPLF